MGSETENEGAEEKGQPGSDWEPRVLGFSIQESVNEGRKNVPSSDERSLWTSADCEEWGI